MAIIRIRNTNFKYVFVDAEGKAPMGFSKDGRIDEGGLFLGEDLILFTDIEKTMQYKDRLAIVLKPFLAVSSQITDNVIDDTSSIIIRVTQHEGHDVKALLDQWCSKVKMEIKKSKMPPEELAKIHKETSCPTCESTLELTGLRDSFYIYCKYCTAIFDKHREIVPNTESYTICPECGYYDRVQDYLEFHLFLKYSGKRGMWQKKHFCCDACAHNIFKRTFWPNMSLLIGAFVSFWQKYKSKQNRSTEFDELPEANHKAQIGKLDLAEPIYSNILIRYKDHPGVHFNFALACLAAGDKKKASWEFQKALEGCANYDPAIDYLENHKNA